MQIIIGMKKSDAERFIIFSNSEEYLRFYRRCVTFAKSYTYNTAQAECMAEEAMIILWKKMCAGEEIKKLVPFLFSTIRNLSLNYLKHKQVEIRAKEGTNSEHDREIQLRIISLQECVPEKLYQADIKEIIDRTLKKLSNQTETIFRLSRFECMSNKKIAQELGISEKSVEYHITKALKELRISLGDYLPAILFLMPYIFR